MFGGIQTRTVPENLNTFLRQDIRLSRYSLSRQKLDKNAGLPTIYGILNISVYRKKLNIRASLKIIGTGTLLRKNTGICCFSDLNYLIFFIPRLFITVIQTASALPGLPTVMSADTW